MIDKGLLIRTLVCFAVGAVFTGTTSAEARPMLSCSNATHCVSSCSQGQFRCLAYAPECMPTGYLCGSGGATCDGGLTIICAFDEM